MKKIFSVIVMLLAITALQAQTCRVEENGFQNVKVSFRTGQLDATSVSTPDGTFTRLTMGDAHLSTEVGMPQVPVMVKLMEIPLCDAVNYEIVNSHYIDYTAEQLGVNAPLFPAQPAAFKSGHDDSPFVRNAETYARNEWYDRGLVRVEIGGVARCINVATVEFSPIQYNPVTNMYRVYDEVEVNFTFDNANIPATYQMKELHGNSVFNGLQSRVINPIAPQNRETVANRPIKYLIVSNSMFRGQLDNFVAWKKRQGFLTEIVYTDDAAVGTTTTTIANYIKAEYTNATDDNPAPTYVLLVGDIQQIPVFNARVSGESHKTDLYYFTWTSGDSYPDCFYGRFSAQNANQLAVLLEKTLQYEQYTMPDPTYLDDAVLVAGSDASWSPTHANGQMNYLSNNYINANAGYSNVHLHLYNSSSQAATIRSEIGAGVGYANYTAHCSEDGWADPVFETNHVSAMSNANKYCFMIGNCCLSCKFDENECFAEAITRVANKGAVAYIGGSNSTIWDEDFYWSVGVRSSINANATYDANHLGAYDRMFHTHGEDFSDWCVTGGSIIYGGNLAVESSTSTYKLYYWEIYHIMGDPSILPWFSQPDVMQVGCMDAMVSGTTALQVSAVPYAYVALTENGEVIAAATTDATGIVTLNFNPALPGNTYELAVTAQGYQPYFKTIMAIVPEGAYVIASGIQPSENNEPNYNADITLDVILRNLGVEDASNITATLNTTSSDVTINNNVVTLSALNHNSEQLFNGGYALSIADNVADNTLVPFTVTTVFDGNDTTRTNYSLRLQAPILSNTLVQSAETQGNNNNAINPGETCVLRITTKNTGHAPAAGAFSHLSCAYNQVTIADDDLSLGDIPAQGDIVSEFSIQIGNDVPEPFIIPFIHRIYAGAYSIVDTVYVFVGECVEDFETGDFSKYNWTTSGNNAWTVVTTNPFEGTHCAMSKSSMSYGSRSTMTISVTAATADSISYYRRCTVGNSWYGSDAFNFYIDNNVQESLSSATSWSRASFPISAGTHTLKFEYYRGGYGGNGGTAAIDYVKFPMNGEMGPILVEELAANMLSIYPNPATDHVNIQLPTSGESFSLVLFDLNGKQIIKREIASDSREYNLNVSKLTPGMYLISLFNNNGAYTGKIVVE